MTPIPLGARKEGRLRNPLNLASPMEVRKRRLIAEGSKAGRFPAIASFPPLGYDYIQDSAI
jgi:hypothetical protein